MTPQDRFWAETVQLKANACYYGEYLQSTINTDRGIKIFLALTSSTSIAGWVIWQEYSFFWAIIIAASQAVNAIKDLLPYPKRIDALNVLTKDFDELFICTEKEFYHISEGKLTEDEIHDKYIEMKKRRHIIIQKHLDKNILPHKKKLFEKSQLSACEYFETFYK